MSYKTVSGAREGKFDSISIYNTSNPLPISINGKQLGLSHLLPKQAITKDSTSYTSLLLPKVHVKQANLLTVDEEAGGMNTCCLSALQPVWWS